jgi:hypothetical protein
LARVQAALIDFYDHEDTTIEMVEAVLEKVAARE